MRCGGGLGPMTLVAFSAVDRSALRWLKTSDRPIGFTLSSGEAEVATLRWKEHPGSLAVAETGTGAWTLKRGGFLNPIVTVRPSSGGADLARLTVHLNYHRVELAGGRAYRFHRAGLLVPAWTVSTDEGRELVHIEPVREGRRLEAGAVVISPGSVDLPELLLLVVLGWYFIVLAWFEDEALTPLAGPDVSPPAGSRPGTSAR